MGRLQDIARKAVGNCKLEVGREKIETDKILGKELTIRDFEYVEYTDKNTGEVISYYVVIFEEYPDNFYRAGLQLSEICYDIEHDEDAEKMIDEIHEYGLVVVLEKVKTKDNNNFTKVTVM